MATMLHDRTQGEHGGVSVTSGGGFTYTPGNPDWYGTDTFEYRVTDGLAESDWVAAG